MNGRRVLLVAVAFLFLLVVGCAGGGGAAVSPSIDEDSAQGLTAATDQTTQVGANLWGYYDLYFDIENKTIVAVPNRSTGFAANVVKFLNNDPQGLKVKSNGVTPGPGYLDIDVDITIKHPLSTHEYDGYDVRGIFIGNGSAALDYNADLIYPVSGTDQILLNADGYSRWFNPGEFPVPKIFGYIPGKLASKSYTGTATLNPYKYFGEGLSATDDLWSYLSSGNKNVGYFLAGTSNTRNYRIRFPVPLPGVKYGYAVVANWKGVAPQDHPSYAPEAVEVQVADKSTLYYVDDALKGGDLILDITVFDWDAELTSGVMEDYLIKVESTVQTSSYDLNAAQMTPTASGNHWYTFHVEIPADNITGTEGNEMWIVVEDSNADYTNPLGMPNSADGDKLAACFRYPLAVSNEEPPWIHVTDPNGGEQWKVDGSSQINWEAHPDIQNVKIELSLNSGVDYTQVISASTPNDGSFAWDPIPAAALGDHDRIKISDASSAGVYDESDADFAVVQPTITVLIPNGGENWVSGTDQEITWTSEYVTTYVNIWYSTDDFVSDIHQIAGQQDNDGSYMWTDIPAEDSNTVKVRVSSDGGPLYKDESDDYFDICTPMLQVTSPNGGEEWRARHSGEIAWDSNCLTGNVSIWYSTDNFVSHIHEIALDEANDGSFMWVDIPYDPSDTVRVKVESVLDPAVYDISDNDFSLTDSGWAITWDIGTDESPWSVVVDTDGNTYVTGYGGQSLSEAQAFLWKFDPAGAPTWERTWGTGGAASCLGAAVGDDGSVYVTGKFIGTDVDFDPGPGTDLHSSNPNGDAYLAKFDSSGDHVWALSWGGYDSSYDNMGMSVAFESPHIFVTGGFSGSDVDFDPSPSTSDLHSSNGTIDAFLSEFDTSGVHVWTGTWGGNGSDFPFALAVGEPGRVYVVGEFSGLNIDFDPDPLNTFYRSSKGDSDVFLSWFDNLTFAGAHTWGGLAYDTGRSVAVDGLGDVYVAGYFRSTYADFNPGSGTELHSSAGEDDAFLSKFSPSVSYQWARTWGGQYGEACVAVAADELGNAFVGGYFQGNNVDFDPGSGTDLRNSNGDADAFWSKFDSTGNYVMARTLGGQDWDQVRGIYVTDLGRIFAAGCFRNTDIEFAPVDAPCLDNSDIHSASGDYDCFLSKYMPEGCW